MSLQFLAAVAVFTALIASVGAVPLLESRQGGVTVLESHEISRFKTYTYFASAAYCQPSTTLTWTCGTNCEGNPGFTPVANGGDGEAIQFWFVGYDSLLESVIVAHQGTDTSKLTSILVSADIGLDGLDPELFPGLSEDILVHGGFVDSHARAAPAILEAVEKTMREFSANRVTLVGHSLGGALALLDAIYLPLHLPSDTRFKTVTYGMPRVGNRAFADYVDKNVASLTRINYKKDTVTILPGRFLGFRHTSGEVHIRDSDSAWVSCPGQDSTAPGCTIDEVPNIFASNSGDHFGPFDGVMLRC